MRWLEQNLSDFTNHLAAKEPVPGGGGAAALIGALAAALGSMAGNYTMGKKAYAEHEAEVRSAIRAADGLRARLLALIDADAEACCTASAGPACRKLDNMTLLGAVLNETS